MSGTSAGRLVVVARLAERDARRHPLQTLLLLVVIIAAATAFTLGLVLHGVTKRPYMQTRAATSGPDVVASTVNFPVAPGDPTSGRSALEKLTRVAGVTAHSGPFPVAWSTLRVRGIAAQVMAEGRDITSSPVDQPKLTAGHWVRSGGVVLERGFAEALDAKLGDQVSLNGQVVTVVGIAVTAAVPVYTQVCMDGGCLFGPPGQSRSFNTGLVWLTPPAAQRLASADNPLTYYLNLRLKDPATAAAFVSAHQPSPGNGPYSLTAWPNLRSAAATLISQEQKVLAPASWLLAILALASIAVVAGGRMAEQNKRVGLLKAAGGTPPLIAAVLLAQHLLVALIAAILGLVVGLAAAPLLTSPGGSVLGQAGTVTITPATSLVVVLGALAITGLATLVPALRAARSSTIAALTDTSRSPRRRAGLIWLSTRLPIPLLLGLRLIARRPRRVLLSAASFIVTAATAVAVLTFHATIAHTDAGGPFGGPPDPGNARVSQVLLVVTVVMAVLAAANTLFTTWATIADTRRFSAVVRALGATSEQTVLAVLVTQLLPALLGAVIGIPAGLGLYRAVQGSGPTTNPSALWLLAVVLVIPLTAAALAAAPAQLATRQSIATTLQVHTI